ncbi:MAG: hypothetical protein QOD17_08020 [Nitrososphaeraceae archaeon]|nr:hypothetical protein [Nitrososphaeraceae archaeon]
MVDTRSGGLYLHHYSTDWPGPYFQVGRTYFVELGFPRCKARHSCPLCEGISYVLT